MTFTMIQVWYDGTATRSNRGAMKNTIYLLLAAALCVSAYLAVFAVKRHLWPSSISLAEGVQLLLVFVPVVAVALVFLCAKRKLTLEASVATFVIFLLSAACFNLTVPAIFDRSVSLYLLNTLDNSRHGMTEQEVQEELMRVYFDQNHAVRKRLHEQVLSGSVRYEGGRYQVTENGRTVMAVARFLSRLYNLDPRIVAERTRAAGSSAPNENRSPAPE